MSQAALDQTSTLPSVDKKWRMILLLSIAELLVMATWFSASAVLPALTDAWQLSESGRSWLTMSVQIGFVVGALGSAMLNLADRIPAPRFLMISAFATAIATALIPLIANGLWVALVLRFITGVFLAGAYPVGMKIMTTWTTTNRGFAIGFLLGALILGSASPHLLNAFGGVDAWRPVLFLAAGAAAVGGVMTLLFVEEGPHRTQSPPFNWRYIGQIVRHRETWLSNLGYLGHMWELYAMWTWIIVFVTQSFALSGIAPQWASATTFAIIAVGGLGSLVAGKLADNIGRTTVTIGLMAVSGTCAVIVGQFFGASPLLLVPLLLVWGLTIPADSAQFSTCVTEVCDRNYIGTALTLQTSMGFLLTLVSIRLVPTFVNWVGWEWAFAFLALGPAVGIWAMWRLRKAPGAVNIAGGRR